MELIVNVWEVFKKNPEAFSIAGAILLAVTGYIAKHLSELRVRRYDARFAFVTAQLRDLYGPLYLLSAGNDRSWIEFRRTFRPGRPMIAPDDPLSQPEKDEYLRWLETVFIPCNTKMRSVIEGNAHLFMEGKAPEFILELLAHFDELNVVLSKLKDGTDDNVFPNAAYPKDFGTYVTRDYGAVVQTHSRISAHRR